MNIQSAESLLRDKYNLQGDRGELKIDQVVMLMVEFANTYREAILNTVAQSNISDLTSWSGNPYSGEGSDELDLKKILKVYPKEKIK